jgi:hypothetical protein
MAKQSIYKRAVAGGIHDTEVYLRVWRRRAVYAGAAFLLSCALVYPFSAGHVLHAHAELFGRILVYLSMALFVPCVICVGVIVDTWLMLLKLRRDYESEL